MYKWIRYPDAVCDARAGSVYNDCSSHVCMRVSVEQKAWCYCTPPSKQATPPSAHSVLQFLSASPLISLQHKTEMGNCACVLVLLCCSGEAWQLLISHTEGGVITQPESSSFLFFPSSTSSASVSPYGCVYRKTDGRSNNAKDKLIRMN